MDDASYPGNRLGMPQDGPGSIARFGRRLAAIAVDWALCWLIAFAVFDVGLYAEGARGFIPLGLFLLENVILVSTLGTTVGHRLLGLRVVGSDGRPPGLVGGTVRSVLLCLAIPALIGDRDSRGLHDKTAGTAIILAR